MSYLPPSALGWVARFNDTSTHAEVLALLDRAIEAERTKLRQAHIDAMLTDIPSWPAKSCDDTSAETASVGA